MGTRAVRRVLMASVALPVAAAAVIGIEVVLARRGADAPGPPPGIDGCVGCTAGQQKGGVLRMVWLGDSTAAGVGVAHADQTLARQVAAGLDRPVELHVLARSGARLRDVLDDQLPAVDHFRPDVVLVSIGANDTTHFTVAAAFAREWDRLQIPEGAKLVALGIPDMGSPPRLAQPLRALAGWRARRLDARGARRLSRDGRATYVDIAAATGPAFRRDPGRYFSVDRYHPSAEGYRLWARAVLEALR